MWGAQSINDEFIIQKHQKTGCFYLKQNEIDASKGTSGAAIFSIYEFNDVNHAVIFGVHTGGKVTFELLNTNGMNPGNIHVLNLDKGKVIDEWQTKDTIIDIAPLVKHGDMTDSTMIYGINNNSMFQMDERIPNKSKIIDCKQKIHKSIPGFNTISTSGNGFIAVGLKNGKIYMKNSIQRKASTVLPGLGNEIRDIEISDDGYWILATCKDYIMVIPTHVGDTQRTGFEGRGMGKLKPNPYVLRLKYSDIQKYKLKNVDFTAAHFDQGVNINEHWIVSSTGSYIVTWDFDKLKQSGIINRYSLT
eukprot:79122_1